MGRKPADWTQANKKYIISRKRKTGMITEQTLFDECGDYLRCQGKRMVPSRRTALKTYTRTCGQPSTIRCVNCGVPLCSKCDTTPKRHKKDECYHV